MRIPKKQRGSASVLLMLVMLALITFAALSMMSAHSELKLSRKNAEWVKGYYALDARGEALMRQINSTCGKASEKAASLLTETGYNNEESLPETLRTALSSWASSGRDDAERTELFRELCVYYLTETLSENALLVIPADSPLAAEAELQNPDEPAQLLSLRAELAFSEASGEPFFTVTRWRQERAPFDYVEDDPLNVWQGD